MAKTYRDLLLTDFKIARGNGTTPASYDTLVALADSWAAALEASEKRVKELEEALRVIRNLSEQAADMGAIAIWAREALEDAPEGAGA